MQISVVTGNWINCKAVGVCVCVDVDVGGGGGELLGGLRGKRVRIFVIIPEDQSL